MIDHSLKNFVTPSEFDVPPSVIEDLRRAQDRLIAEAFGVPKELLISTNSTASEVRAKQSLSIRALLQVQQEIERAFAPRVTVHEDCAIGRQVQTRTYARRRAKSASHWQRMNKKWRKRYGYHLVPEAYAMEVGRDIYVFAYPALGFRRLIEALPVAPL